MRVPHTSTTLNFSPLGKNLMHNLKQVSSQITYWNLFLRWRRIGGPMCYRSTNKQQNISINSRALDCPDASWQVKRLAATHAFSFIMGGVQQSWVAKNKGKRLFFNLNLTYWQINLCQVHIKTESFSLFSFSLSTAAEKTREIKLQMWAEQGRL